VNYDSVPANIKLLINYRKLFEVVRLSTDLDLYSKMARPITAEQLSHELEIDGQFIEYFLTVLYKFGFVDVIMGDESLLFVNTSITSQYLDSQSTMYLGKELFDDEETYALLQKYVAQGPQRTDITQDYWSREILNKLASIALLGGVQSAVEKVDLSGRNRLLDLGGGHGLYSIFFTEKYSNLKAWVLDFPEVTEITREFIVKYGAQERVQIIAGDYKNFKPQQDFDVVFISNVTASYPDLLELLAISQRYLRPGGVVILRNFVTDNVDEWSSLSTLERYARRGKKGVTSKQLEFALQRNGFTEITRLYAGEGVVILQGIARTNS
jgi:predicted O-methyltransferase YrrM